MRILLIIAFFITFLPLLAGCKADAADSPTAAYKMLFAAVKSKNTESIKRMMSKQTLDFANAVSQRQNTPIEKVFENGFTATTFSETLPEIRDERVAGEMAAIEVWNSRDRLWEDLPFIKEAEGWKLAVGDLFKGTWTSPGKGRALKEREAANVANSDLQQVAPPNLNANMNANGALKMPPNASLPNAANKPSANK